MPKKKALVGLSGGVDSALVASLLKEDGYEVICGYMSFFDKNKTRAKVFGRACYDLHEKARDDEVISLAKSLDVPLLVCDMSEAFEEIVLDNFKKEYLAGRTPNPCVYCNYHMKFGLLPEMIREKGFDFDYFATGHYAISEYSEKYGQYVLKIAVEEKRDQTYFLYRLSKEQLSRILFPLGKFSKEETRRLAEERGVENYDKPDSQDFYSGDYSDIIGEPVREGDIVDINGVVLGKHQGFWNFTLGQRRGLGIAHEEPLYVIALRPDINQVVVGEQDKTFSLGCVVEDLSFILPKPKEGERLQAKIRSTQAPCNITIKAYSLNGKNLEIEFEEMQKAVALGQSCVIYNYEGYVVGGGIIKNKI